MVYNGSNGFEIFVFFWNILKFVQDFSFSSKQFLWNFFILQGFLQKNLER